VDKGAVSGNPPRSLWLKRADGGWGQQFGSEFSALMLRYPLQGDYSITFRTRDGNYGEGAATLAGRLVEFLEYRSRLLVGAVGMRSMGSLSIDSLKNDQFNAIRFDRKGDTLSIHVNDEFHKDLEALAGDFPFFGMGAMHYRETTFDSLKIEGDVSIPRSVDMLSPNLLGWTARFKDQRLQPITILPVTDSLVPAGSDKKIDYDWRLADGVLESTVRDTNNEKPKAKKAKTFTRTRREGLVRYLRPLCPGEQISLEFYHESGKHSLAPALGRVAMLLDGEKVALHWITSDPSGVSTGIDDTNRVVDNQAEQLKPIVLRNADWNQLVIKLAGDVVTVDLNGEPVYRRVWQAGEGRQFGLFHDPSQYHVRVRQVQLSGDWPEKLPADLFELRPKRQVTLHP